MDRVSGRVTAFIVPILRRRGVDVEALVEGTGFDVAALADPNSSMTWDELLVFLERIEARGGRELILHLGSGIVDFKGNRPLRALARFFWTEKQFWRLLATRLAPGLYPFNDFGFERLDDGRCQLTVRIPESHRESETFMYFIEGFVRAIPRFLGGAHDAEVESHVSPRVGVAIVRPSLPTGIAARALRAFGGRVVGDRAFDELERRQRDAERTTAELGARNRTVATLQAVADAITQSVDFGGTAERIADAFVEHAGFSAAALYTTSDDVSRFELSAARLPSGVSLPAVIERRDGIGARALAEERVVWSTAPHDESGIHPAVQDALRASRMQSFAVVPLGFQGSVVGMLGLSSTEHLDFGAREEASLMTLGKTVAAALMSARYVARIETEVEERRAVELELRRSEERLRQIAENVDGVFYLMDAKTDELLYMSPNFERITGHSSEPARNNARVILELIHPDDRGRVEQVVGESGDPREYEVEYRLLCADGSTLDVLDRVRIIRNEDGEPVRLAGFAQDVTQMRALEHQLRHSQKMDAVGRLAGSIAHDFNNLLTVILAESEALRDRFEPGSEDRRTAEDVLGAADRAAVLTRRLLTLARKQPVRLETLDLSRIVIELDPLLRSLLGDTVRLALDVQSDAPVLARGDRGQIEQVLVNLAVNGRDAMPEGGTVTIGTRIQGPDRVEISVSDTGAGMAPEIRARAFEPFFSTKDPERNTGLGLAIVHGIVEHSGGRIRLESESGKGCRFEIELPRVQAGEAAPIPDEPVDTRGDETLLVVEDQEAVRNVAVRGLRNRGYRVLEAADGETALEVAANASIDLLVTDVVMPGMNGVELAAHLSKDRPDVPVLFMSGYTGENDGATANIASEAMLAKPFTPESLAAAVRARLDSASGDPR